MMVTGFNDNRNDTLASWKEGHELADLISHQLYQIFHFSGSISPYLKEAIERSEKCFCEINSHYFCDEKTGRVHFSPFRSNQYAMFLYYLSNVAYHDGNIDTAEKIYYLNKSLNGVEWFYEVELPEIFYADHPLGCVLGRAKYRNYFKTAQGCTVGNNHNIYPDISDHVIMHPYSMIIGNSHIGSYVEISAYSFIRDQDIPSDSLVFGQSPELKIIKRPHNDMVERFSIFKERSR